MSSPPPPPNILADSSADLSSFFFLFSWWCVNLCWGKGKCIWGEKKKKKENILSNSNSFSAKCTDVIVELIFQVPFHNLPWKAAGILVPAEPQGNGTNESLLHCPSHGCDTEICWLLWHHENQRRKAIKCTRLLHKSMFP